MLLTACLLVVFLQLATPTEGIETCSKSRVESITGATQIYGWGSNWNSQLTSTDVVADNVEHPTLMFVSSMLSPKYTAVASGVMHTVVLDGQGGAALAAGDGSDGQLGIGAQGLGEMKLFNTIGQIVENGIPVPISSRTVLSIAAGSKHTCLAVQSDVNSQRSSVYCAGANNRGQLGNPKIQKSVSIPFQVDNSTGLGSVGMIVAVASGPDHMAALGQDGSVWTWGAGKMGELGNGASRDSPTPVRVNFGSEFITAIQCGFRFCLALTRNKDLFGWGINMDNQLGSATPAGSVNSPVKIASGVTLFAAGGSHSLAVIGGRLHSWGAATMGQTGQAPPANRPFGSLDWTVSAPTPIAEFTNVQIQSVAAGMHHSSVIDTCGRVYSFGSNDFGQLGVGELVGESKSRRSYSPVLVTLLEPRRLLGIAVYAGPFTSFVVASLPPS